MGRDTQRDIWSSVASRRKERFVNYLVPAWEALLDAAGVTAGTALLDAGCGSGELVARALARAATVTGIDLAPNMVEICRATPALQSATFAEGSIEALPFPDGAFEAATSAMAIHFCDDVEQAFREVWRVVKPGGRVAISAPASPTLDVLMVFDVAVELVPPELRADMKRPLMFAADGALQRTLERAGFRNVRERVADTPLTASTFEELWEMQKTWAPVLIASDHAGEAVFLDLYQQRLFDRLGTRTPSRLDMRYRIVAAEKP